MGGASRGSSCISVVNDAVIQFSDLRTKSKMNVLNPSLIKVERHKVDGCLIADNTIRCDWKFVVIGEDETRSEVYIELKGKDISHAVEQIVNSVKKLSDCYNKKFIIGYVICTRSPVSSSEIQVMQKKLQRDHKIKLRIKKTVHTEDIDKVIA